MDRDSIEFAIRIFGTVITAVSAIALVIVVLGMKTICPAYINTPYVDYNEKTISGKCEFDKTDTQNSFVILCNNKDPVLYKKTTWYEYDVKWDNTSNNTIPYQKKVI